MSQGERALVTWLRERTKANPLRVPVGVGDDMAAVRLAGDVVWITADMLMDGADFHVGEHSAAAIGRKALACSLSDCAAMAVRPLAAVASVALPRDWGMVDAQGLYEGMAAIGEAYACPIVGGDTNSWGHPLAIDVTVIGQAYPRVRPVRRSGAQPGDGLYVSGPLGGSLLGRHMTFEPRVREARRLAEVLGASLHALIDLSDGLALDLWRVCESSGVGAEVEARAIEAGALHDDARKAAQKDGKSPLEHALHDGEDYELLAACGRTDDVIETKEDRWVRIGRVTASGLMIVRADGKRKELEARGWEHAFGGK